MKQNEPVTKIMTENPTSVSINGKLAEVAEVFAERNLHHVPIVEGDKLAGLITYTDLMRLSFADAFHQDKKGVLEYLDQTHKVTDVMKSDIQTLTSKSTVKEAAKLLCQGDFHCACVVDDTKKLLGIVTSTDVIRYLVDLY